MKTRVVVLGARFGGLEPTTNGPKPTGTFQEPSEALVAEKANFGSSRIQRWFGQSPPTS